MPAAMTLAGKHAVSSADVPGLPDLVPQLQKPVLALDHLSRQESEPVRVARGACWPVCSPRQALGSLTTRSSI